MLLRKLPTSFAPLSAVADLVEAVADLVDDAARVDVRREVQLPLIFTKAEAPGHVVAERHLPPTATPACAANWKDALHLFSEKRDARVNLRRRRAIGEPFSSASMTDATCAPALISAEVPDGLDRLRAGDRLAEDRDAEAPLTWDSKSERDDRRRDRDAVLHRDEDRCAAPLELAGARRRRRRPADRRPRRAPILALASMSTRAAVQYLLCRPRGPRRPPR